MSSTPTALLRDFLEQQRWAGQTHLPVRRDSLEKLASLRETAARRLHRAEEAAAAALSTPAPDLQQLQTATTESQDTGPQILQVPGSTVEEKLRALRALAETAEAPRALGTLRSRMVFAVGSPTAQLMLIGEAPGAQEERQGEPFVGPAGSKLTQILKAMGLERSSVYISNICKFRPAMGDPHEDQGTRNRKPTPVEMRSCLPFILTEIALIQPRCIIALGATAAEGLGLEGSVGRLRGTVHEVSSIPTIVTYHPSYILREEATGGGLGTKRQVWEDMLRAMEILGMPISEKQRSFFTR